MEGMEGVEEMALWNKNKLAAFELTKHNQSHLAVTVSGTHRQFYPHINYSQVIRHTLHNDIYAWVTEWPGKN